MPLQKAIRRASISGGKAGAAVSFGREAVRAEKLVYVAVADRAVNYGTTRSHIVYIGTTQKGIDRIASSAATHLRKMLTMHGIKSVDFFVYTVRARQKVEMWKKLERALILQFKDIHGVPPRFNTNGKRMMWKDEKRYFAGQRLMGIIALYDHGSY